MPKKSAFNKLKVLARSIYQALSDKGDFMINPFDLHVHTSTSDGEFTSAEIVRLAAEAGIKTIAITDHDNIDGIGEGLEAGKELGVQVIPGVELSCQYKDFNGIHILGYFINHKNQALQNFLYECKAVREKRSEMIVEVINRHLAEQKLPPLSIDRLKSIAGGSIGRPHISRLLIEMGYAKNTEEAFKKFLIPYNIPKKKMLPQHAIQLISNAGGIAVLAHPHMLSESREKVSRREIEKGIRDIADHGLVGLEAFYSGYTLEDANIFCSLARELGLEITAGTDYHSLTHPGTPLGFFPSELAIPPDLVDNLLKRHAKAIEQSRISSST
jgi:predicted metal-dependent phosphoesterase TrpH